ncbi:MAG: radical SAM protein [Bacteroidales bacterium]|jgi:cyclic pyranopterin phosphate synthase|nr:radical SAM protein [Bacteroidales bacterium]
MLDRFNRHINYLRISVTDRCNLRCVYCMPEEGVKLLKHSDILSYDEIFRFTEAAVRHGIDKVRVTGGEPLVRRGIVTLIEMLASIEGIKDLSMTTNGILLSGYASDLKRAGLRRVNISLDTIDPEKYRTITRTGNIEDVFTGIEAAKNAGLLPIKINCVIRESPLEPDARQVAEWCYRNGIEVRFIEQMNLSSGSFSVVHGGEGGNCAVCNRLRLTANGKLRPCLFSDIEIDVREEGFDRAIMKAIEMKPACGTVNSNGRFYNIGG